MDNELAAKTLVHLNQLAMEEIRRQNYPHAIGYFTQSLVLEEKLGLKAQMAESFYNMAGAYFLMEDYEQALRKAQMAETIFKQEGKTEDTQKTLDMIGEIEEKLAAQPE